MYQTIQKLCMSSLLMACLVPTANATVIDFEGFAAGTIIDNEYDSLLFNNLNVSAENLSDGPDRAVIFDTDHFTGGDDDLAAPFNVGLSDELSPGNVLIIHETNNCTTLICDNPDDEGSRPAGIFTFEFDFAITLESINFFDVETAENGTSPNNIIKLYDGSNADIGTFYTPDTGGDNKWKQLNFGGVQGVRRIELKMGGSGAIDDLTE